MMSQRQTIRMFFIALMAIILPAALGACGFGTDGNPPADQPSSQVQEVTPSAAPQELPASSTEDATRIARLDLKLKILKSMTPEQCSTLDHFEYLGGEQALGDPRVSMSGAVFHYDCNNEFWGVVLRRRPGTPLDQPDHAGRLRAEQQGPRAFA